MIEVGAKLERLAVGEPTEIGKTEHAGSVALNSDYSGVTDEQLAELVRKELRDAGYNQHQVELLMALLISGDRNRIDLVTWALLGDQYAVEKLLKATLALGCNPEPDGDPAPPRIE